MMCAIYIRRSKKDKNNPGYRLEYQRQTLPQYAHSQGWDYEVFDEGMASAANIQNLVQLKRIISRIKEFDVILAIEYTRFSRDASAQDYIWFLSKCMESGIKLATPQSLYDTRDPLQWFALYQAGGFSAVEIQRLTDRLKQGKIIQKDKGSWLGGIPPAGYKYNPVKKQLELNRKEAKLVLKVFQMLVDYSMAEIERKLTRYRTRRGCPIAMWWIMKISSERRLFFYAGMVKNSNGDYIPGQHPPIISDKLRREILIAKAQRRKEGTGSHGHKTLFGGLRLLRCGYCGKSEIVRYVVRPSGNNVDYYMCSMKGIPRKDIQCKESRYLQTKKINELLINDLIKRLQDKKLIEKTYKRMSLFKKDKNPKNTLLISNQIEREENRKRSLIRTLGRLKNDNDIISEIEEVKKTILELYLKLKQDELPRKLPFKLEDLQTLSKKIENFRSFNREKQREIIKAVIKQIRFFREKIAVQYTFLPNPQILSLQGVCRKYNR